MTVDVALDFYPPWLLFARAARAKFGPEKIRHFLFVIFVLCDAVLIDYRLNLRLGRIVNRSVEYFFVLFENKRDLIGIFGSLPRSINLLWLIDN
jgi:hypothetical protein